MGSHAQAITFRTTVTLPIKAKGTVSYVPEDLVLAQRYFGEKLCAASSELERRCYRAGLDLMNLVLACEGKLLSIKFNGVGTQNGYMMVFDFRFDDFEKLEMFIESL